MTHPWVLLAVAIVSEGVGTAGLKASDGFTRLVPILLVVVAYGLSFYLIGRLVVQLPLGLIYAMWAGAGTALSTAVGVLVFGDAVSLVDALGIAVIIAGIAVLNSSAGLDP